jgi:hypothetical protein
MEDVWWEEEHVEPSPPTATPALSGTEECTLRVTSDEPVHTAPDAQMQALSQRLQDPFSKLFLYNSTAERTAGFRSIVRLLTDMQLAFVSQRIRPEVVQHFEHLANLHDADALHVTFFFLLCSVPAVLCRIAHMTDVDRFCRFMHWLLPLVQENHAQLHRENIRILAQRIRVQWTLM